jgi:hypothetical protein
VRHDGTTLVGRLMSRLFILKVKQSMFLVADLFASLRESIKKLDFPVEYFTQT